VIFLADFITVGFLIVDSGIISSGSEEAAFYAYVAYPFMKIALNEFLLFVIYFFTLFIR
jgi:hypothetical protein